MSGAPLRPGDVFDGHLRIDSVLVQQADAISPQPPQHLLDDLADMVGPGVPPVGLELETELRRDDHLVANRLMSSMTVMIGGFPAARLADLSMDGTPIAPGPGCPTVIIGG
jgi:hypothetical protein